MKKGQFLLAVLFIFTLSVQGQNKTSDLVIIEVLTGDSIIEDALIATKSALLKQSFIAKEGMQNRTFTATRTTGSQADYFVADVVATDMKGKIKITITFVKVGTGFLNLANVAANVKATLEGKTIESTESSPESEKKRRQDPLIRAIQKSIEKRKNQN